MKYNIYIIISLFLLSSCGDSFLELSPSEYLSAEESVNSADKMNAVLIGAYNEMQSTRYLPTLIQDCDVKGTDIFVSSSGNYGRHVTEYGYSEKSSGVTVFYVWDQAYKVINNVNVALDNIEKVNLDEKAKLQISAECKALRAASYLNLIQVYATPYSVNPKALGVPAVKTKVYSTDVAPARNTVEEVYALIIEDLLFASKNLNTTEKFRINGAAAKGLLARAYLLMGNWSEASKWAKEARDGFKLMDGTELSDGFKSDSNSEWMWSLRSVSDDNSGYLHTASFYDVMGIMGYNSFRVDVNFVALFKDTDLRKQEFYINKKDGKDQLFNGGYVTTKFTHVAGWEMDQVLMRASEMYLIEAEAEAELGNNAKAQEALFAIQSRSKASDKASVETGDKLIAEILLERRKELFGEGFAWFDLNRRGLSLTRKSSSHWEKLDLAIDSHRRIWPIPDSEIEANKLMVQNKGY